MEFNSFLDYLQLEKQYSPKTIVAYKNDLTTFYDFNLEKFEQKGINKANYSQYVLESGEIQRFVQGQLGRLIKENMSDKGKIFIGGATSEKFSGTTYTSFEA